MPGNRYNNRFCLHSFDHNFFLGVPMSFRRVGWVAAVALATLLELSCGQVYRPVVIPVDIVPPNPGSFHEVFGIATNLSFNFGTAMQIDVSGDSNIGQANMGINPTHAAILPNNSRVFVASAGSIFPGEADSVIAFTPASDSSSATGLGSPTTFSLPAGSQPVFLNTTQLSAVFVANYGTNSVSTLNTGTNTVTMTGAVGAQPVALAETPDAQNLYVVNQGSNSVTDLSPNDLAPLATITVGNTPVWAVSRSDSKRIYVVTQGDGQLYTIRTDANTVLSNQSVGGPGANFALYDKGLNRLYVTNPNTSSVYVFDVTGDSPALITTLDLTAGGVNAPCPTGCSPVSVAALADGSRFYVASYQNAASCPDPVVGATSACIIPRLTVYDALSLTVKPATATLLAPSLSLLGVQFAPGQYAVPAVPACAAVVPYTPSSTRFRVFTTAAADSSHVYVSVCDAGSIADINATTSTISSGGNNTPDTLITDLGAPFAACTNFSLCGPANPITSFSITSNVVTFQSANNFVAGQRVQVVGLTTGTYLNGLNLTVLPTGLSSSQFQCYFTSPDVPSTTDTGTATPVPPLQDPAFLLTGS